MLKFKWPELRGVALELIGKIRDGHRRHAFSIPVVEFLRVFAPEAAGEEFEKVAERGDIRFMAERADGGRFSLAEGERATFELPREGLTLRIPERMSGKYEISAEAFRIEFNEGEELEGCKRILILICNEVRTVDISSKQVHVGFSNKMFDLCVEFE